MDEPSNDNVETEVVRYRELDPAARTEVVRYRELDPPTRPIPREHTAHFLALGIAIAFAFCLLTFCIGHVYSMFVLADPPPQGISKDDLEAWLKWREQLGAGPKEFAQTLGTLLAGPFGVVLGFYFRDRSQS